MAALSRHRVSDLRVVNMRNRFALAVICACLGGCGIYPAESGPHEYLITSVSQFVPVWDAAMSGEAKAVCPNGYEKIEQDEQGFVARVVEWRVRCLP